MMKVYINIKYNFPEKYVRRPSALFNASYLPEWLEDEFVDKITSIIDKTPKYIGGTFLSPVLGIIAPTQLSGGVKALMLIKNYEGQRNYSSVCFGENCIPFLAELSFNYDFTLVMEHSLWDAKVSRNCNIEAETFDGKRLYTMEDVSQLYLNERYK